jgi:tRNA threonylcarbamoyladenosine biosynthesis protein TsaB
VRILGIETSSSRGSVALVDGTETVFAASHEQENSHDSLLQPLIERALAEAGWQRRQLERIAVGIGPGSFTGLRVGIAYAQGLAAGLEIPLTGVGSLLAMTWGAPPTDPRHRVALLDARRGELFVAAYAADGRELLSPQIARDPEAAAELAAGLGPVLLLGQGATALGARFSVHASVETDLPHARWAALASISVPNTPPLPLYLRPPVAVVPELPPSPFQSRTVDLDRR